MQAHLLYIGDWDSVCAEEDLRLLRVVKFLQLPLDQLRHRVQVPLPEVPARATTSSSPYSCITLTAAMLL